MLSFFTNLKLYSSLLLLLGTGFIGRHLVAYLVKNGFAGRVRI